VLGRGFRVDINYSCVFEAHNHTGGLVDAFSSRELQVFGRTLSLGIESLTKPYPVFEAHNQTGGLVDAFSSRELQVFGQTLSRLWLAS